MGLPFPLPHLESCPFCDTISRKLRKGIVEETELTFTLVNARQFSPGQVLVVPRRHAPTLFDLSDEEAAAVMASARRVGKALVKAYDSDGMMLYQNNGVVSSQEVPHFHLHVVPLTATCQTWGSGPPHVAAVDGLKFRSSEEGKIIVSLEEERVIAEFIKRHFELPS